jgi:hypothetical protein
MDFLAIQMKSMNLSAGDLFFVALAFHLILAHSQPD